MEHISLPRPEESIPGKRGSKQTIEGMHWGTLASGHFKAYIFSTGPVAPLMLMRSCVVCLWTRLLVDVVSDYHKPFPELLTKLLDFLGGFIRRNHPSLACKHTGRTCGEAVMGWTAESLNREFKQQTTTELGWNAAVAPPAQEMRRMHELRKTNSDPMMVPVVQEIDPYLEKAWSVAY